MLLLHICFTCIIVILDFVWVNYLQVFKMSYLVIMSKYLFQIKEVFYKVNFQGTNGLFKELFWVVCFQRTKDLFQRTIYNDLFSRECLGNIKDSMCQSYVSKDVLPRLIEHGMHVWWYLHDPLTIFQWASGKYSKITCAKELTNYTNKNEIWMI